MKKRFFTMAELFYVVLFGGWLMNIYKFVNCDFEPSWKEEIIRGISMLVFPVGGFLGFFNF
jgi:hypothetical protein